MHEDYDRLASCAPISSRTPRDHIPSIIAMIEELIDKDYAYVATNGDVMYSVSKFAPYGKLSGTAAERSARGRARRGRRGQARSARLRAVEAARSPASPSGRRLG